MATVRTALLCAAGSVNGVFTTRYTCPAGHTAILKDVRLTANGAGNTRAVVAVASGAAATYLYDQALAALASLDGLFVVLEPGDVLQVYSTGNTFTVRASGAELLGVAP